MHSQTTDTPSELPDRILVKKTARRSFFLLLPRQPTAIAPKSDGHKTEGAVLR
jgi:hypothetical protein